MQQTGCPELLDQLGRQRPVVLGLLCQVRRERRDPDRGLQGGLDRVGSHGAETMQASSRRLAMVLALGPGRGRPYK